MAGVAKPPISNLGREGSYVINEYWNHASALPTVLFDGFVGAYSEPTVFYWHAISANYLDITLNQKSKIWSLLTTTYTSYGSSLKVYKWDGANFIYIGNTSSNNTSEWFHLITLDEGRYKFVSNNDMTIHCEWYVERITEPKILINSSNKILTLLNSTWTDTLLEEPLTKSDFEIHGMTDLSGISKEKWNELGDFEILTLTDNNKYEIKTRSVKLELDSNYSGSGKVFKCSLNDTVKINKFNIS